MKNLFNRFVREEEGQDLTEYGLLVAFIAFIVIAGVTLFGQNLLAYYNLLAGEVGGWAPGVP
jgi:pilus assembly protein Flp/PilA